MLGANSDAVSHPSGIMPGFWSRNRCTVSLTVQLVTKACFLVMIVRQTGSYAATRLSIQDLICSWMASLSKVWPVEISITGSLNRVKLRGHISSLGISSRSLSRFRWRAVRALFCSDVEIIAQRCTGNAIQSRLARFRWGCCRGPSDDVVRARSHCVMLRSEI